MSANRSHIPSVPPAARETVIHMFRRALGIGGVGAIATLAALMSLPSSFKTIFGILVALLVILFEIILRVDLRGFSFEARQRKLEVRSTLWSVLAVILLASGLREAANVIAPTPSAARSMYYMVVLDASQKMNTPFDEYPSKWGAVQSAFRDFLDDAHQDSHYGLVLIGGQNPAEIGTDLCSVPSVPRIPLVSGSRVLDGPLADLRTELESQRPEGGGSLSEGFSLAKNQLESLPLEKIKIIVLIASATDECEGAMDWDALANDIELVNKGIAIHEELILVDGTGNIKLASFEQNVNQAAQTSSGSNTYVQVVNNYYELRLSITNMLDRLDMYEAGAPMALGAGTASAEALASSTSREQDVAPRIDAETDEDVTPRLVTLVPATRTPNNTRLPPTFTRTKDATATSTCTSTLTPTVTLSRTASLTPPPLIVVTIRPTRRESDEPEPEQPPPPVDPPAPPQDPCCKHCGSDSQPCGDSCISLEYTCTEPPGGCACP